MHLPSLALAAIFAVSAHGCYEDSRLFRRSDNSSAALHFSYTGLDGPLNWAGLDNSRNSLCSAGKMQTPINLDSNITKVSGSEYIMNIPSGKVTFENKGHTVEVHHVNNGTLKFNGKTYNLVQLHFHTPSEHRINDEYFPLEVHFVHKTGNGSIAVVGFVIDIGMFSDRFLGSILGNIDQIEELNDTTSISSVSFRSITNSLSRNEVFRYQGSLTTPPCTEGLEWIVSEKPLMIDFRLFNKVKKILKFNSRYTQTAPGEINLLENAAVKSGSH